MLMIDTKSMCICKKTQLGGQLALVKINARLATRSIDTATSAAALQGLEASQMG